MSVIEKVIAIIADQMSMLREDVEPSTRIEDTGADSLDLAELIVCLEDDFGIEIVDADTAGLAGWTVAELAKYVEGRLAKRPQAAGKRDEL